MWEIRQAQADSSSVDVPLPHLFMASRGYVSDVATELTENAFAVMAGAGEIVNPAKLERRGFAE